VCERQKQKGERVAKTERIDRDKDRERDTDRDRERKTGRDREKWER